MIKMLESKGLISEFQPLAFSISDWNLTLLPIQIIEFQILLELLKASISANY